MEEYNEIINKMAVILIALFCLFINVKSIFPKIKIYEIYQDR